MRITVLGTGHGMAKNCYNTCFLIEHENKYILVDGGGGNQIFNQLDKAKIDLYKINAIFISHIHMDHLIGVLWIVRSLLPKYYKNIIQDEIYIYGNDLVISVFRKLFRLLMPKDFQHLLNTKVILIKLKNNQEFVINNLLFKFFDTQAIKTKLFGFNIIDKNKILFSFIGDEVCNNNTKKYIKDSKWLFADAYTSGDEAKKIKPEINHHHSSVEYISKVAEECHINNLILSHTLDNDLINRKKKFTKEAKLFYNGNIYIPEDLEFLDIK